MTTQKMQRKENVKALACHPEVNFRLCYFLNSIISVFIFLSYQIRKFTLGVNFGQKFFLNFWPAGRKWTFTVEWLWIKRETYSQVFNFVLMITLQWSRHLLIILLEEEILSHYSATIKAIKAIQYLNRLQIASFQ